LCELPLSSSPHYDSNLTALAAVLAEWASNDAYPTRVQDLFGALTPAPNGATLLNESALGNDLTANQLNGGTGQDWVWLEAGSDMPTGSYAGKVVTANP
jgi:hypothetical protein